MARDGNGTYTAPVNTWNPAINGVLASAGDWQQLLNDIVAALTQSVSRDGQTPMTGNLVLGNHKITGLTLGSGTGEALAFQQLFNQGTMADIASAATTDIGLQNTNFLRVTGNTTITSFGTNYRGPRFLVFEQNITLTNSSTLVLPGGANISANAGDAAIVIPGATLGTPDKWIVVAYQSATNPSQIVTLNGTQTLTNKTINLASNTARGTLTQFNEALTDADFATLAGAETLTNKTLTNPVINGFTGSTAAINIGSGQLVKDTAGNLGLGVTPSAWSGFGNVLEVAGVGSFFGGGGSGATYMGEGAYYGTGAWRYSNTGVAPAYYHQDTGAHKWFTAPSGTAGNAISFTQAMTLFASSALNVGATVDPGTVGAIRSTGLNGWSQISDGVFAANRSDGMYLIQQANAPMTFATNNTERARIDSSGNLIQSAPASPPSLTTNGQMVFNLTSNTNSVSYTHLTLPTNREV